MKTAPPPTIPSSFQCSLYPQHVNESSHYMHIFIACGTKAPSPDFVCIEVDSCLHRFRFPVASWEMASDQLSRCNRREVKTGIRFVQCRLSGHRRAEANLPRRSIACARHSESSRTLFLTRRISRLTLIGLGVSLTPPATILTPPSTEALIPESALVPTFENR